MTSAAWIGIGILIGLSAAGLALLAGLKIIRAFDALNAEIARLKEQLKGRQPPDPILDRYEDLKANINYDERDLEIEQLLLSRQQELLDERANRLKRQAEIYNLLRNGWKTGRAK